MANFGKIKGIINYQTEDHKVISFSLWGNNPKYTVGALENIKLAKTIYPDWICRFYIGADVDIDLINQIKKNDNVSVYLMEDDGGWNGMFWRFYPASDKNVSVFLSRDCDSRLNLREKSAVEDWLSHPVKKMIPPFCILRDHPWHTAKIMGGMWGSKRGAIEDIHSMIESWSRSGKYNTDQEFLASQIWPIAQNKGYCVYDPFYSRVPFPTSRENDEFVGEVFDENNRPNLEHKAILRAYKENEAQN